MTRVIGVIGGKGGVGKTTLVSNLATSLANLGNEVIAVDGNVTTPNLGLHLGVHLADKTLHNVLRGEEKIEKVAYAHPLGFKVVPASMNVKDLQNVDVGKLPSKILGLYGKADYVILDSAAGLGREAVSSMQAAEEILLITNPDLPSVADALKTAKLAENLNKKVLGVVVNRVRNRWDELTKNEIEKMIGYRVISEIPADPKILESIHRKAPLASYDIHSPASVEINRLAHTIDGREFNYRKPISFGLFNRLLDWVSR